MPSRKSSKPTKNALSKIEIQIAADIIEERRRKTKRPKRNGYKIKKTRIDRQIYKRERLPPPVPKNKSMSEIHAMDPDDPAFKDPLGRGQPRKYQGVVDRESLSWRDKVKYDKQAKLNDRRAGVRKYEAEVVAATNEMEKHVSDAQRTKGIFDEDKAIAEGILSLEDWDDEELIRGYRRLRSGRFGKAPEFIPREVQQQAFRILVGRGERMMKEAYLVSVEKLIELAHSADSEKVRLEAQKELLNRVVGKVPDRMVVAQAQPWEGMLADSMVPISEVSPLEMEQDDDGVIRLPYVDVTPAEAEFEGGVETPPPASGRGQPTGNGEAPPPSKSPTKTPRNTKTSSVTDDTTQAKRKRRPVVEGKKADA